MQWHLKISTGTSLTDVSSSAKPLSSARSSACMNHTVLHQLFSRSLGKSQTLASVHFQTDTLVWNLSMPSYPPLPVQGLLPNGSRRTLPFPVIRVTKNCIGHLCIIIRRMHSSRMRTGLSLPYGGVSVTETPPRQRHPGQRSPWTETPLDRDHPGQKPPGQRPPTETLPNRDLLDRGLPGQRPPDRDPLDRDRDPPCGQTDTCENITFANIPWLRDECNGWVTLSESKKIFLLWWAVADLNNFQFHAVFGNKWAN